MKHIILKWPIGWRLVMKMQNKIYNLYIYKWSKELPNKIRFDNDIFFLIRRDITKFGIVGIKVQGCDFWYRLRFKSEEDLNLFKLLANIKVMDRQHIRRNPMYQYD